MKYLAISFSLVFTLLVLSGSETFADDQYFCDDGDCPWGDTYTIGFNCGGCLYVAYYQTRTCTDPPYDDITTFKITKVEKVNPN